MEHYKKAFYLTTKKINSVSLIVLITLNMFLTACSSIASISDYGKKVPDDVVPIMADREFKDNELLDVSIKLIDPGKLPEDKDEKRGLSMEIRKSESRYIPIHLKYTMQRTGYWGNVRVVPDDNEGSEILITGSIEDSDGESIELKIKVVDARKKLWFEKIYKETVRIDERKKTEVQKEDTFQNLYNKISNDIIEFRQELNAKEIQRIRQISEIRFANYMAPKTFSEFITTNKEGEIQLNRLPSEDDPMMKRVKSIKARDELLIDTLNNYYDIYYSDMWDSYDNWRNFRSEEMQSMREINNKALTQKVIGVAAIIGAIALGASSNSDVRDRTGVLRSVMIAGGGYALYSGFQSSKETEINKEAIEELDASFSTEVEPMVIEVKGKRMELTGSADQQYAKWRNILKEIYIKETGFD